MINFGGSLGTPITGHSPTATPSFIAHVDPGIDHRSVQSDRRLCGRHKASAVCQISQIYVTAANKNAGL